MLSTESEGHVLRILRTQHVAVGPGGRRSDEDATADPEVLYLDKSMISPVLTDVPVMIRAKTWKAVSGW